MNKKLILEIGIPLVITSKQGSLATILLNKDEFVVCEFSPNQSVYLNDAKLVGWYPKNILKRQRYFLKRRLH